MELSAFFLSFPAFQAVLKAINGLYCEWDVDFSRLSGYGFQEDGVGVEGFEVIPLIFTFVDGLGLGGYGLSCPFFRVRCLAT